MQALFYDLWNHGFHSALIDYLGEFHTSAFANISRERKKKDVALNHISDFGFLLLRQSEVSIILGNYVFPTF